MNTYAYILARAVDVLCATFIWRNFDVTISSYCGLELRKEHPRTWAKVLGWVLNHLQKGHCEMAIQGDIERARESLRILNGQPD